MCGLFVVDDIQKDEPRDAYLNRIGDPNRSAKATNLRLLTEQTPFRHARLVDSALLPTVSTDLTLQRSFSSQESHIILHGVCYNPIGKSIAPKRVGGHEPRRFQNNPFLYILKFLAFSSCNCGTHTDEGDGSFFIMGGAVKTTF